MTTKRGLTLALLLMVCVIPVGCQDASDRLVETTDAAKEQAAEDEYNAAIRSVQTP